MTGAMKTSLDILTDLNERSRLVFSGLVETYLSQGAPVGSRTLSRDLPFSASPATIRNVMQDLEYLGLLDSPHTSAGRVPTQLGLRLFVDSLLNVTELSPLDAATLSKSFKDGGPSVDDKLQLFGTVMSEITRSACVVMSPKKEAPIKHIDFVSLNAEQAIVVLVFEDGTIENRLFTPPPGQTPSAFREAANFLNARAVGLTINGLKDLIERDISVMRAELDGLTQSLIESGIVDLMDQSAGYSRLIVRGRAKLIEDTVAQQDLDRVKELFDDLERKKDIAECLELVEQGDGMQIFIGAENKLFSLSDSSMVVSPFAGGDRKLIGAVGVIGPTRMNYGRIVPLVEYAAHLIGQVIASDKEER